MKSIISLIIAVIIGAVSSEVLADPIQWKSEDGGNDNWYDVVWYYSTWEEAYTHSPQTTSEWTMPRHSDPQVLL